MPGGGFQPYGRGNARKQSAALAAMRRGKTKAGTHPADGMRRAQKQNKKRRKKRKRKLYTALRSSAKQKA